MTVKSGEQVLEDCTRDLGPKFGPLFCHAHWEWCNLWSAWHQFENLFGRNKERVDLLNKAGGVFFAYVDKYFFEATVLAICRLSDPVQSMGKDNLTVMKFIDFMETPERKLKMQALLDNVKAKTDFHRDWRNRKIGHNDLALKTGKANPLKPATRKGMNDAIAALYEVFAYVDLEFRDTDLANWVDSNDGEIQMLYYLFDGVRAEELKMNSIRLGQFKNLEYPDWLHKEQDNSFSTSKYNRR